MASVEFELRAVYETVDAERKTRGLSWAQVAREVGGVSPATIRSIGQCAAAEGDGVLQVLRWLGRSPESFVVGEGSMTANGADLPPRSVGGTLRFDARAIFDSLEEQRVERRLTWRQVADESGVASPAALTRFRTGGRVSFPEIMKVLNWLGKPAAKFVRVEGR